MSSEADARWVESGVNERELMRAVWKDQREVIGYFDLFYFFGI